MSSGAAGTVVVVPVAAVGLGVVAIAGVGIGLCYLAGKGLVAGVSAVQRRCEENAAARRACKKARKAVYRASRQTAAKSAAEQQARWQQVGATRQEQERTIGQLAALKTWINAPINPPHIAPLPSMDNELKTTWPEIGEVQVIDQLNRIVRLEQLSEREQIARRLLEDFEAGGPWEKLYPLRSVSEALDAAEQHLVGAEAEPALDKIRMAERYLHQMQTDAANRWAQRAAALRELTAANDQMSKAITLGSEHPELLAQAEALTELLGSAQAEFDRLRFVEAESQAGAVARQAQRLAEMPDRWERDMLLAEAAVLREEIEAHGQFAEAAGYLDILKVTTEQLQSGLLTPQIIAEAENALDQVGDWADQTLRKVETVAAGTMMRQHTAHHVANQLVEMGYDVDWSHEINQPPQPEETWRLLGRRLAPGDSTRQQTFVVELNADGTVWLDATQGYRERECDDLKTFISGLQARGVQGYWEPFYSAEVTAQKFRDIFTEEGYMFYEERSDEGLVITLIKGGEGASTAVARWDGELEATGLAIDEGDYREVQRILREEEQRRLGNMQALHY